MIIKPFVTEEQARQLLLQVAGQPFSYSKDSPVDIILHIFAKYWKEDLQGPPFFYFRASKHGMYVHIIILIKEEPELYLALDLNLEEEKGVVLIFSNVRDYIERDEPVSFDFSLLGKESGPVMWKGYRASLKFPGNNEREFLRMGLDGRILSILSSIGE